MNEFQLNILQSHLSILFMRKKLRENVNEMCEANEWNADNVSVVFFIKTTTHHMNDITAHWRENAKECEKELGNPLN